MPSKSLLLVAALLATASPQRTTPALALFDYVASEADELTLRRGESLIILQTQTDDAGWARGRLGDGREGLLPLDYVRLLPDDAAPEPQRGKGSRRKPAKAVAGSSKAKAPPRQPNPRLDKVDEAIAASVLGLGFLPRVSRVPGFCLGVTFTATTILAVRLLAAALSPRTLACWKL